MIIGFLRQSYQTTLVMIPCGCFHRAHPSLSGIFHLLLLNGWDYMREGRMRQEGLQGQLLRSLRQYQRTSHEWMFDDLYGQAVGFGY